MTKLARRIDGIPVVASTTERDLLYPTPDTDQRVQIRGSDDAYTYDGSAWVLNRYASSVRVTKTGADDGSGFVSGDRTEASTDHARFLAIETITGHGWYGFMDRSVITNPSAVVHGHATFADIGFHQGANVFDHHNSFQDTHNYQGTATLTNAAGFYSKPEVTGTGPVTNFYNAYAGVPTGTGAITNMYGFFAEAAERTGATNVWGFYALGNAPNRFGGSLTIDVQTGGAIPLTIDRTIALPGAGTFHPLQTFRRSGGARFFLGVNENDHFVLMDASGNNADLTVDGDGDLTVRRHAYVQGSAVVSPQQRFKAFNAAGTTEHPLIGLDANNHIVVGTGDVSTAGYAGFRIPKDTLVNLHAAGANQDGIIAIDTTNNRLVFYSGGARRYITATGTF